MTGEFSNRRAAALVAAILLLAITSIAVASAVTAAGDDSALNALRANSMRSFYAAESGIEISLRQLRVDPSTPYTGPTMLPDGSTITVEQAFNASPAAPGTTTITGAAGVARRTVEVTVQ